MTTSTTMQNTDLHRTTTYKVVLPFYVYASISFFIATLIFFLSSDSLLTHYFQPPLLAITHIMALGWGTMIIFGAGHQLIPVIIEGKLYSERLAYFTFILASIGIPILVYSFYVFNMGTTAEFGGCLIFIAVLCYLINVGKSMLNSNNENINAIFVFTATIWLLVTVLIGLILLHNFNHTFLQHGSIYYLPVHAHVGIIGWFLLLVIGVGSKLIPMFLISKYNHPKLLWWIFININLSLISYFIIFYLSLPTAAIFIPGLLLFIAIVLFLYYCWCSFKERLRKQVDDQMKISLLSSGMLLAPLLLLMFIILAFILTGRENIRIIIAYGFLIFFGWLTAIIIGMTFKTLPFIVWNKTYHQYSASGKTPNPKDLFNHKIFKIMGICYLSGIIAFSLGLISINLICIKLSGLLLMITAFFYNLNVIKIMLHKPMPQ